VKYDRSSQNSDECSTSRITVLMSPLLRMKALLTRFTNDSLTVPDSETKNRYKLRGEIPRRIRVRGESRDQIEPVLHPACSGAGGDGFSAIGIDSEAEGLGARVVLAADVHELRVQAGAAPAAFRFQPLKTFAAA
jgi:hypothetical protein